jgi:hypothetical protein
MRRICFYTGYLLRNWPASMVAPCERRLFESATLETMDGIKIVGDSLTRISREANQRFHLDTIAALRLIKSVDSRRFRRLQREVSYIVNSPLFAFASYSRATKSCYIDYPTMNPDTESNPEWYSWWYASVLVHEATHGAIFSRLINYTPDTRVRIERLCHTEQRRFATRSDTPDRLWSEPMVGMFDEKRWHGTWHSTFWRRFAIGFKVVRERF